VTTVIAFHAVDVIKAKRDGEVLTDGQIRSFLEAYTAGAIAEEQAAALLMAIFWRGMTADELTTWTDAMVASGERLDLSTVGRPTVDKHSTGGVGDKVSLPLVAIVAACGAAVPQLSGRGLGHTGGTLDKMESIPGWRAVLPPDEMTRVLQDVGGVICAAGPGLAPADRMLYALRDVTGTVESIPLIASSIMSKKIAEGTQALVLDVKVGTGAFMSDLGQARALAETMVQLGQANGVRTSALITAMDTPLGRAVGNAVEVEESLDVLRGEGPEDLVTITHALAREMLALAGVDADADAVRHDGRAMATWRAMVVAQGGDPDATLPRATDYLAVRAPESGYVTRLDARAVGNAVWRLGAGRARKEDPVSKTAGIWCRAKPGEWVEEGQPVMELAIDDPARVPAALDALTGAFDIGPEPPPPRDLIIDYIHF
jgi:thymidine phosphorylase